MRAEVIGLGQMGRGIASRIEDAARLGGGWDRVRSARVRSGLPAHLLLPPGELARAADAILFVVPNACSFVSERRFPDHDLGTAAELTGGLGQPSPYTALTARLLARAVRDGRTGDDFTTLYPGYDDLAAGDRGT